MTLLKQQLTQKDQTLEIHHKQRAFYEQSLNEKEQTLKSLTTKTFKLS